MTIRAVIDSIENQLSDVEVARVADTVVSELFRRLLERTRERDECRKTLDSGAA